ncbi:phosphoglycerate mutase family protein [Shewanella donghaensis]|uniref:phosphoglycerate mutase family protein n=1 Tax=Shewanella donghaensis TaxID=238836 RepID=UPI0013154EF2|nr:phosphoglycerate mutase family protein [Shewanella donghaensis]
MSRTCEISLLFLFSFMVHANSDANPANTVASNSLSTLQAPKVDTTLTQVRTLFLVRHGEKLTGDNPDLSEQGRNRALTLANTLSAVDLDSVFSTDYKRTQQTALPTAQSQSLAVTSYNPRDLASFAKQLHQSPHSEILIVGHSNTTPKLVELLGGNPGTDINEKNEFDRLYIVSIYYSANTIPPVVTTVLLKY